MINLWEGKIPGFDPEISPEIPSITPYLIDKNKPLPVIIVVPGGGYTMRADHEGAPVARWLNGIGISAFVLNYRVAPYRHPYPSIDAKRAIRLVRHNANRWNIDPKRVGILGFSAGGHVAATVGTYFKENGIIEGDPVDREGSKPDAMILCYSVITFGKFRHDGSMVNLIGKNPDENLRHDLSCENMVNEKTAPTFLWHTSNDSCVPVENSLLFASALSKNKVPFEMHIFPKGDHGLGLAKGVYEVEDWPHLCEKWLRSIGF
ncbi:MAG: alpha/beta hydrolase [Clostridiales bacterium]|nr:alpha/beta hydrolase [Clostridiales bacterium]HBM81913.1 alpha/beta hydrolase [Clostridiaceae bacterium]